MLATNSGGKTMDKTEAEQKFEEYRDYLRQEATRLASYIALYRRLHELRAEGLTK